MLSEFSTVLHEIDQRMVGLNSEQIQEAFDALPLEVFGALQIERPLEFPNLISWMPMMASDEVQRAWTGNAGHILLRQSTNFIRTVVSAYHSLNNKPLSKGTVLDFGCGWGRLIRLIYKYVPIDNVYGVDPWDRSLEECNKCNLHGKLFLSDYLPRNLPTPADVKFDLIIAFSVFTHLSEKATHIAVETLTKVLTNDGIIAITIRPVEYWSSHVERLTEPVVDKMINQHMRSGFAFFSHNGKQFEGEATYGDTSMTVEYIRSTFTDLDIVSLEWSEVDPHQIYVFLKKKSS